MKDFWMLFSRMKIVGILGLTMLASLVPELAASDETLGAGCPRTGDGKLYSDGCAGADPAATYRVADFFTYAAQSQQRYKTRPPWNVAGVDYPVGHHATTLKDPETVASDPEASQCSFAKPPALSTEGARRLTCAAKSAPIDIDGYEFGSIGGHNCTYVHITDDSIYPITIENSDFDIDDACSNKYAGAFSSIIFGYKIKTSITVRNNTFNGHGTESCCNAPGSGDGAVAAPNGGNLFILTVAQFAGTLVFEYNAAHHWPGHIVGVTEGTDGPADLIVRYNYIEGFHTRSPQGHGEVQSNGKLHLEQYSYNTVLEPSYVCACNTALFDTSTNTAPISNLQVDHNVMISNWIGGATAKAVTVTTHQIMNGILTIDSIGLGNHGSVPIAPGQSFNGTALTLLANVGGGQGAGSQWSTDCGAHNPTNWCSQITTSRGTYNNNTSYSGPAYTNSLGSSAATYVLVLGHGTYINRVGITDNYMDASRTDFGALDAAGATCNGGASDLTGNTDLNSGTAIDRWVHSGAGC